ncbi:hypothetical protein LPJ61_006333 [Coemansia biformis]|uniref:Uncharacterized protein n=1 Tax=Coemansia biformis TaxID=1286918 RepID=A0A9W8CPY8_9FUNG|nr:hypothetical protein LPJ61_006333 [Coemansia biformis]
MEQWGQGPARPATQGVSADLHEHQRVLQALHSFGMVTADGQLYADAAALNMGGAQMTHDSRTATTPLPGFAANVSMPPPMSYGVPGMMSAPDVHLDNGHQYVLAAHANRLSAAGQPHNYPPDLMMAMYNGKVF